LRNLKQIERYKNIRDFYRGILDFKKGYQSRTNIVNDEKVHCQRSNQHKGGVNRTCQADIPVISEYTNLKKLLMGRREKGSILQDSVKCVCAAHKKQS
jgi:hypothetical protein